MVSAKEHMVDEYGQLHASGIHVPGRIVLNLWRQMQVDFGSTTFEGLKVGFRHIT